MSSKHRLTRSFRTVSAAMYLINISWAIHFMMELIYLHVLVGFITAAISVVMLIVAVEAPKMATDKLERSAPQLYSFRGRYCADVLIALFLIAMPAWGIVFATFTMLFIFGIRFLGVKQPDAFNEIFRQSDIESQGDSYTLESEYDTPVSETRR